MQLAVEKYRQIGRRQVGRIPSDTIRGRGAVQEEIIEKTREPERVHASATEEVLKQEREIAQDRGIEG